MADSHRLTYLFILSLLSVSLTTADSANRFPEGFLLGFATASYQIEGGWNADGKGENIWDHLTHNHPEMVTDRSNGDIAADSYHKYKEDVAMLKTLNAQVYRFSLSWSRILPTGDIDVINKAGIDYYNNLINELLRNGIEPMVTLYHWDLPQPLQLLGGWTNILMVDYFEEYARIAFKNFGDRVKIWLTFNEPLQSCQQGYGSNSLAPAINQPGIGEYLCSHTIILAHARAYHVYNKEFRPTQKGKVGITLDGGWIEPASNSPSDIEAAETRMQFEVGWYAHPIIKGDYPEVMRRNIDANSKAEGRSRSRLPVFDDATIAYVNGTIDFLGVNHYTTSLARKSNNQRKPSWDNDSGVITWKDPSWPGSALNWLKVVPWGFRKQLNWVKKEYNNIPVIITENGYGDRGKMHDTERIDYFTKYIREMLKAIYEDGCNVLGYTAWSVMDNFEWLSGYTAKFGIYHVDFESPQRTRTPKSSAKFFRDIYARRELTHETDNCSSEDKSNVIPHDRSCPLTAN